MGGLVTEAMTEEAQPLTEAERERAQEWCDRYNFRFRSDDDLRLVLEAMQHAECAENVKRAMVAEMER